MYFRVKRTGAYAYLQIVESFRDQGQVRQHVVSTVGRLDVLQASGQLEALMRSGLRFCEKLAVIDAHAAGQTEPVQVQRVGPDLVFGRLWEALQLGAILQRALESRRYEFDVERAIYLTVIHRLFAAGSDRAAERWRQAYRLTGTETLDLHHLYRAMAFLGEALKDQPGTRVLNTPRCTKDWIEEQLFEQRRDLFSEIDLVFFDTTSIYFEGEGGQEIGEFGKSKDHRPDRKQMVVGLALDLHGWPLCCELWPGNTADVTTLLPVVNRLRQRFRVRRVSIVADRGMISATTIAALESEELDCDYILGARMRSVKEIRERVLADRGRYQEITPERKTSKDPSPLKVKEVTLEGRRYIVCLNEEQRRKDAADRQAIVAHLREHAVSSREVRPLVEEFVMKDGRTIYLLADGRLVNLACAEGHPANVMDMSFANQALAAEYMVANCKDMAPGVYDVPADIDNGIAKLKLATLGVQIDELTPEQAKYLASWQEGTV